jgi:hypothetical protein
MKKYRRTRITVRTREVLLNTGEPAPNGEIHFCPLCHAPMAGQISVTTAADISLANAPAPKQIGPAPEADQPNENELIEPEAGSGPY